MTINDPEGILYHTEPHWSRRALLGAGIGATAFALPAPASAQDPAKERLATPSIQDPTAALAALMEGNLRWQNGTIRYRGWTRRRMQLGLNGQNPFAVVFGCIDSRVPPEIVLDQDVNDIFDARTAAHTLAPVVTGSIEYGPQAAGGTPLILVLGHQKCGAASAAVDSFRNDRFPPDSIKDVVFALQPAYAAAKESLGQGATREALIDATIRFHVQLTVDTLARQPGLKRRIEAQILKIVGGYYTLETGAVELITRP